MIVSTFLDLDGSRLIRNRYLCSRRSKNNPVEIGMHAFSNKVNARLVQSYMQLCSSIVSHIREGLSRPSLKVALETHHGYGRHSWDIPLSLLTAADIRVRKPIGSIVHHTVF